MKKLLKDLLKTKAQKKAEQKQLKNSAMWDMLNNNPDWRESSDQT